MDWLKNPGRLSAYSDRIYITRIGRLLLICMLVCAALGVRAPTQAYAGESGSGPTIDLATDRNNDGIPDELAAAVAVVAVAEDKEAAIKDLVSRLPYSEETRALQQEAERLQAQLTEETSDAEAEQIKADLQALTKKMAGDPNYVRATDALMTLFTPDEMKGEVSQQSVNWNLLQPGDILLHRDIFGWPQFVYAMVFDHTGNYHGDSLVYEAVSSGVRLQPLAVNWQVPNKLTAFARNTARAPGQVTAALHAREAQYGTDGRTPYNYFFPNKWTDYRLYCAQLTWKIHLSTGVNLDSNHWQYQLWLAARWGWWVIPVVGIPAVAPDEIWLSPFVRTYHSGMS